jgi:RNA polymerase sigma-70 factor (ECF subfamily)
MDGAEPVARDPATTAACNDATLITQSLQAPERFGALFDRHAASIYRYVTRRLGPDAADDIVAETFLTAFRRRDHYDTAHPDAGPWLYGIATRLIGRHRRDEVRFFRAIARTGTDPAAEPVADRATERAAARALRRQLADAMASLSPVHRDVLLLTASGLGYQEVADALGIAVGTVSSRLVRARRRVRASLGPTDPTEAGGEPGNG